MSGGSTHTQLTAQPMAHKQASMLLREGEDQTPPESQKRSILTSPAFALPTLQFEISAFPGHCIANLMVV